MPPQEGSGYVRYSSQAQRAGVAVCTGGLRGLVIRSFTSLGTERCPFQMTLLVHRAGQRHAEPMPSTVCQRQGNTAAADFHVALSGQLSGPGCEMLPDVG